MAVTNTLQLIDYLVIAVMLCISTVIGIYYRFSGGRQKTTEEYFVADRSMNIVTVAIGLVVSFISAIALLGTSAEIYKHGIQFGVVDLSYLIGTPIVCYGFLPVFFKLQATSIFEYLEKRFGVRTRIIVSFIYCIQLLVHTGVVLYAPSLALEATTGMSKAPSIIVIGLVCTFYSTIGGIKAVLVTDVLQSILMFGALFLIIGTAASDIGGLGQIWEIARQGQRIEFDFNLDPAVKYTWWSLMFHGLSSYVSLNAVNQMQIQRMLTVKNMQAAKKAVWLSLPLLMLLAVAISSSGLAIYSKYHNCDPFLQKRIASPDMLMPLYVMDTVSHIPGLPGLFVAGIFSAGLSTISAALNALAAITLEDYIKPAYRKCIGPELSPTKSIFISKVLTFTFGIVSIALAFLVQLFGGILQASITINGIICGPSLGIFTLGMSMESATEGGAIAGALIAISFLFWILFGQPRPEPPKWSTTIKDFNNSIKNITIPVLQNVTSSTNTNDSSYFYLYRISHFWYASLGFLITFIVGLLISKLFRLYVKGENDDLDSNLFFPVIARRIQKRRRHNIDNEIRYPLRRKYSFNDGIDEQDSVTDKIHTKL